MSERRRVFFQLAAAALLVVVLAGILLSGCTLLPSVSSALPPSTGAPLSTSPSVSIPASTTISPASPSTVFISPSPSPTVQLSPFPTPSVTPTFTPFVPSGTQAELFNYMLGLINQDRQSAGLAPVVLGTNSAAQQHAQDMFDNYFISHWGTDGLKPYMRYTLAGGYNYEDENSAYSGWFDSSQNPDLYQNIDVKQELKNLEYKMMYDDAGSNWGHRDNILNKWHKRVNLGIAYDNKRVALVEEFEGDYVQFSRLPALAGNILSLSGQVSLGSINQVLIAYDKTPQPLTPDELLNAMPHFYSLGNTVGLVIPPAPPGSYYPSLPADAVLAGRWNVDQSGNFDIQADISKALASGPGVYTVCIIVKADNDMVSLTNYSLFVK